MCNRTSVPLLTIHWALGIWIIRRHAAQAMPALLPPQATSILPLQPMSMPPHVTLIPPLWETTMPPQANAGSSSVGNAGSSSAGNAGSSSVGNDNASPCNDNVASSTCNIDSSSPGSPGNNDAPSACNDDSSSPGNDDTPSASNNDVPSGNNDVPMMGDEHGVSSQEVSTPGEFYCTVSQPSKMTVCNFVTDPSAAVSSSPCLHTLGPFFQTRGSHHGLITSALLPACPIV
jgi:hypothetical protein